MTNTVSRTANMMIENRAIRFTRKPNTVTICGIDFDAAVIFNRGRWVWDTAECFSTETAEFVGAQAANMNSALNAEIKNFIGVIPIFPY